MNSGLSNTLMKDLKLQTLWEVSRGENLEGANLLIVGIMGSILGIVAAFVFFAISALFISRFVILIFVMVLSPIAFIAFILPKLSGYKDQWVSALIHQSFFAPLYFMLTFVVIKITSSLGSAIETGSWTDLVGTAANGLGPQRTPVGGVNLMVMFMVIIAMLIASLIISKQFADKAGSLASGLSNWVSGKAGGATFGLAGKIGRETLGRAGERISSSDRLKAAIDRKGPKGWYARSALWTGGKMASGSMDIRGTALGKKAGAGTPYTGGYAAILKERKERKEIAGKARRGIASRDALKNGVEASAIPASARNADQLKAVDDMERELARMSDKEIEAIVGSNKELLKSQEFANAISVKQLEAINKSESISTADKDTLKATRFGSISKIDDAAGIAALAIPAAARTPDQAAAAKAVEDARTAAKGLTTTELEMLDPTLFNNEEFVSQLKAGQVEDVMKSNKFTTSQKAGLISRRRKPLTDALASGNIPRVQSIIKKTDAKTLVSYMNIPGPSGINIALDPAVLPTYTTRTLKKMAPEMSDDQIRILRAALGHHGDPAVQAWLLDSSPGGGMHEFNA
jgi:hypothetical protein